MYAPAYGFPKPIQEELCVAPMYVIPAVETGRYLDAHGPASLTYMVKFQSMRVSLSNQRLEALEDRHPTSSDLHTYTKYMYMQCVQVML